MVPFNISPYFCRDSVSKFVSVTCFFVILSVLSWYYSVIILSFLSIPYTVYSNRCGITIPSWCIGVKHNPIIPKALISFYQTICDINSRELSNRQHFPLNQVTLLHRHADKYNKRAIRYSVNIDRCIFAFFNMFYLCF